MSTLKALKVPQSSNLSDLTQAWVSQVYLPRESYVTAIHACRVEKRRPGGPLPGLTLVGPGGGGLLPACPPSAQLLMRLIRAGRHQTR